MKKYLPLFVLLLSAGMLRAQKVVIKDSSVTIENGTDTFPGQPNYYTYNNKCLLAERSSATSRNFFSYYPDGKPYQTLSQGYDFDSGKYVNLFRGTNNYNAIGQLSFDYSEIWNAKKGVFEPYDRDSLFYNAQGLESRSHVQTYDAATSSWVDLLSLSLYYNNKQQLDSTLFYQFSGNILVKDFFVYYEGDNNYRRTSYQYNNSVLAGVSRTTNYRDSVNYVRKDSSVFETLTPDSVFVTASTNIITAYFDTEGYVKESGFYRQDPSGTSYLNIGFPFYGSCPSVLPVAWLSFSASRSNHDAVLNWRIADETNVSSFSIERSTDGVHFTAIGSVPAHGNGGSYTYTDRDALLISAVPKIYYRMIEADKDGSTHYSTIASLDAAAGKVLIAVSPNPAANVVKIYSSITLNDASISVSDLRGRIIYSAKQTITAGSSVPVDVSAFAKGIYIVTVQSSSYKQQVKVMKE